jgi:hypothetical protein
MNSPGFVLAYHGCDRSVGERILSGADHVRVSSNRHDWLGAGAYFWENSPDRALSWAEFLHAHPQYSQKPLKEPFVIGAVIAIGRCLDLTESHCLAILQDAYQEFEATMRDAGTNLPHNEKGHSQDEDLVKRYLDCAVIDFLHLVRQERELSPFDTLRGAFFEGGPLFPGAGVARKTHIQWCVRNPRRSILGYFRPLPDGND